MASVQFKRMNWFQKRPLYKVMDAWRQRRREANAEFLSVSANAAARFANAQINLAQGSATLAGQQALLRVQDELKKVTASLSVDKLV
jgi:hypothetical protein